MITDIVDNTVDMCISDEQDREDWDLTELEHPAPSGNSPCRRWSFRMHHEEKCS